MKTNKMFTIILMASFIYLTGCSGSSGHSSNPNNSKPVTSSGYMSEDEYKPTVNDKGEYHTIDGTKNQIQYQGSKEQKNDLDAIDEYARTHPGF